MPDLLACQNIKFPPSPKWVIVHMADVCRADYPQCFVPHHNCSGCLLDLCYLGQVASLLCNTGNRLANLHLHIPVGVWPCIIELLQQGYVLHCAVAWVHTVCLGTTAINWSVTITKQVAEKGHFRDDIQCRNESEFLKWVYRRAEDWSMVACLPFSPAVKEGTWARFLLPLGYLSASQEVLC